MSPLLALVATLHPARIAHAPHLDGHLDDAVWAAVPASDAFTQAFPHDGATPSDPTRVQVAYDDDSIYVAIDCTQHAPSVARLTRRDRDIDGDRVGIDFDTSHDHRSAFHFQVSAAGVLVDGLRYDDTELALDWDEIWQAEVATTPTGWSAEIRIPLRILRLHASVATWGFQVRRWTGATGEVDMWSYAPRDAGGEVSRYGDLGPFDGLEPRGSIALVPFVLSRIVRTDPEVPSAYGDGLSAAAGLDVTWRPSQSVAISGAVLPDFGQVEADQAVINLTTTETEYPEKRPFFLQGMDLFQTPIQLLYTRRIGRTPELLVYPDGVTELQPAGAAPVLAAGKLLANIGPVEIGALSAATGEVTARTSDGEVASGLAASHHVLRVRASGDNVSLGILGTAQLQSDDMAHETGFSAHAHDALVGGVDGAWRSESGAWTASGQVVGTRLDGGPPILRPDGTLVKTGDLGFGTSVKIAKEGGPLRAALYYDYFTRQFDIDDLGYQSRANVRHGELDLEAYTAKGFGPMVEARSRIEIFWRHNLDGLVLPGGYQWNVSGTTEGMWETFLEIHWRPHYFDDRELGDGRALERSGRLGVEFSLKSDPRKAVVAELSGATRFAHDGGEYDASLALSIRPRANLELSLTPELLIATGEPRFVADDPAGPRFARLAAHSLGITTRATWTLTRELTLQAYAQALLATIDFSDPFTADPSLRVVPLDALEPASFDPAMYSYREGVLDANIIARWEYRPGSTLFLVYAHAASPATDRTTYDPLALVHGPASDVVLAKLSWAWLR